MAATQAATLHGPRRYGRDPPKNTDAARKPTISVRFISAATELSHNPGPGVNRTRSAATAAGEVEEGTDPFDDPDHDWESDPIVPGGRPVTWEDFAEDARAGEAGGVASTPGPIGVVGTVNTDGLVALEDFGSQEGATATDSE
ncbi:hypothetical protein ACFYTS_13275 [Nocardia sp. NPDC004151]|uniref:hypothetical protein n=1 Tax=Nocardia sp. NPDC004151 TaxID=3364304 RepID=UPI00369F10A7